MPFRFAPGIYEFRTLHFFDKPVHTNVHLEARSNRCNCIFPPLLKVEEFNRGLFDA